MRLDDCSAPTCWQPIHNWGAQVLLGSTIADTTKQSDASVWRQLGAPIHCGVFVVTLISPMTLTDREQSVLCCRNNRRSYLSEGGVGMCMCL